MSKQKPCELGVNHMDDSSYKREIKELKKQLATAFARDVTEKTYRASICAEVLRKREWRDVKKHPESSSGCV